VRLQAGEKKASLRVCSVGAEEFGDALGGQLARGAASGQWRGEAGGRPGQRRLRRMICLNSLSGSCRGPVMQFGGC
jgi:hypothetical protein